MPLTIREKEEWQAMCNTRIDRAIEEKWAQAPALKDIVETRSLEAARESLGVLEMHAQLVAAEKLKSETEERIKDLNLEMLARLNGTTVEEERKENNYHYRNTENQVKTIVQRRQVATRKQEMLKHPTTKEICELEQERENLKETIWLATGVTQIKELWEALTARLEQTPTPLEQAALNIKGPTLTDGPGIEPGRR